MYRSPPPRDDRLTIRLRPAERVILEETARVRETDVSDVVRRSLRREVGRELGTTTDNEEIDREH